MLLFHPNFRGHSVTSPAPYKDVKPVTTSTLGAPTRPSFGRITLHEPHSGLAQPATPLDLAITRATSALLAKQAPGGWWVGELQGDSILESEYILLKWIVNQEADPDLPLIANYLRNL